MICLDEVALVIIERDDRDFNFPAFSPLSADYTIHIKPAKEGWTERYLNISLDYLSRDCFLLLIIRIWHIELSSFLRISLYDYILDLSVIVPAFGSSAPDPVVMAF